MSGELSYNAYLKIKDEDSNETKFAVTKNNKGKLKLEAVRNDFTLEGEHAAKTAEDYAKEAAEGKDDKFESEATVTDSFSYKVKLSDLQIAASYCNKGKKEDKYVDVRVTSDVELYWMVEGKFETELDGEVNSIKGDKDYCTHIKLEDEDEIDPAELAKKRAEEAKRRAEEAARKKLEEARRKALEELEKAIEEAIEKWLEENYGGC